MYAFAPKYFLKLSPRQNLIKLLGQTAAARCENSPMFQERTALKHWRIFTPGRGCLPEKILLKITFI